LERVSIEQAPCRSARFCLMIHITELDPELGIINGGGGGGEELPTYQVATNGNNMVSISQPPPSYELTALATAIRPPEPIITAR
jgi:hypothetical protein